MKLQSSGESRLYEAKGGNVCRTCRKESVLKGTERP